MAWGFCIVGDSLLTRPRVIAHASFFQSAEHVIRAAYPIVNVLKDTEDQGSEYNACSFIAPSLLCSLTFFLLQSAPPSASLLLTKCSPNLIQDGACKSCRPTHAPLHPGQILTKPFPDKLTLLHGLQSRQSAGMLVVPLH